MGDARGRRRDEIEALTAAAFRRDATAEDVAALRSAIGQGASKRASSAGPESGGAGDRGSEGGQVSESAESSGRGPVGASSGDATSTAAAEPSGGIRAGLRSRRFWFGVAGGAALTVIAAGGALVVPAVAGHPLVSLAGATPADGASSAPATGGSTSGPRAADDDASEGDGAPSGHGADPAVVPDTSPSAPPLDAYVGTPPGALPHQADGVGVIPGPSTSGYAARIENTWQLLSYGIADDQHGPVPGGPAWAVWATTTRGAARCYMAVEKHDDVDTAVTSCVSGSRVDEKVQLNLPAYIVTVKANSSGSEIGVAPAVPGPQG
ncbi:hypothetical protein [Schumannella soli]|uniref:Uncharacterized protein n=1 Tax=Schumannella soli TaxID=2590779 RepID=A0A506XXC3_9MICO|nr:hypothetical protein [Schumannella soli]TPW74876.1 hypothetical protein FJ657_15020 [Schumannella soli]